MLAIVPKLAPAPERVVTHLILCGDGSRPSYLVETQLGFAWSDMLDLIASGEHDDVRGVYAWDMHAGTVEDVSKPVARELATRTFDTGRTCEAVRRFCGFCGIDTFDPDRARPKRDPNAGHRLTALDLGVGRYL